MIIPISEIYFSPKKRLREDYGDLTDFAHSFSRLGQLVPIIVRPYDKTRDDPDEHGFKWTLDDGGRRFITINLLHQKGQALPGLPPGHIRAELRENAPHDEVHDLFVEFYSNDNKRFDWKETAEFVRRVHSLMLPRGGPNGEEWTVGHTAAFVRMAENTVYQYLQLTESEEVFQSEEVQKATTFRNAAKQTKLVKERKRRQLIVEHVEKQEKEAFGEVLKSEDRDIRALAMARGIATNGDSRDWIRTIEDQHFDWVHWDPPFGGEQEGGAFTAHELINDSWGYARDLHADMIPQLFRTLKDGHWMAIWCHQSSGKMDYMRRLLQGHDPDPEGFRCRHCGKSWEQLDPAHPCPKSDTPFWVNPYAVIWHKANRASDGHDIVRYLRNDYETFLLAAKWDDKEPILPKSSGGNVLSLEMVTRSERRHVMHKPAPLLAEILSIISIPGELGCDPGAGSFSIVEAAIDSGRKIEVCELSKNYYVDGITITKDKILQAGLV